MLQLEPVAGAVEVGPQCPAVGLGHAVEQHRLDARVVVEVLEVLELRGGAQRVNVERRRGVSGQAQRARTAERTHAHQLGDPSAAGHVGLEHVHGARLEHPLEVREVVAVLARGDRHAGRRAVANQP